MPHADVHDDDIFSRLAPILLAPCPMRPLMTTTYLFPAKADCRVLDTYVRRSLRYAHKRLGKVVRD